MPTKFSSRDAGLIWEQLRRIADSLEALVMAHPAPPTPESTQEIPETPEPTEPICPHPAECRMDLGTTPTGEPEWECTQCRRRFP